MFKVGDEVVLPLKIEKICNEELVGAKSEADVTYLFKIEEANRVLKPRELKTYTQGLSDAWELARKLFCEHNDSERREILGIAQYETVLECMTPEEALAKIEAYEKKHSVCVGDVVKCGERSCVITVIYNQTADVVYSDGTSGTVEVAKVQKTGKHIDIESLLLQIGE